jgi:hypothetical protein
MKGTNIICYFEKQLSPKTIEELMKYQMTALSRAKPMQLGET